MRAGQSGVYVQDKFQFRSNLSLTAGLRWDWDGGFTEKYGRIYNFDPSLYSYDDATDTLTSNGIIIAGNNKLFPSHGVSNTTLTGRQWGLAPRLGVAWSPKRFNDKVVVRAGTGLYYDRGELFSYLSPGFAEGVINGGPFGFNQTPPYVNAQSCGNDPAASGSISYYLGYVPTCPSGVAGVPNYIFPARGVLASAPLRPAIQWTSTITFRILERPGSEYRQESCKGSNSSPSPPITAPTSCLTPSTTRSTFSGSRVTILPSRSATSATSAATV